MSLKEVNGHCFSRAFLNSFNVICEIGAGFSGTVVLAEQISLKRQVAIKLLDPHTDEVETLRLRFEREAKILCDLHHQNVIRIYDYGFDGNVPYLVQEYLDGESLLDQLDLGIPMTNRMAVERCKDLASALAHAHKAGVLHRDIKPANVFITKDSRTVLLDFGLAVSEDYCTVLTKSGYTVGTPLYMAPEQMQYSVVTPAADIYSLGMVLFRLLTGEFPFDVANADFYQIKLAGDICKLQEINPSIPLPLATIVDKCLAFNKADRYQEGKDLLVALERLPAKVLDQSEKEADIDIDRQQKAPPKEALGATVSHKKWLLLTPIILAIGIFSLFTRDATKSDHPKREFYLEQLYATEVQLRLVASPPCRATVTAHIAGKLRLKNTVMCLPEGKILTMALPSGQSITLTAHFADRPDPTVISKKTKTPDFEIKTLVGRFELERKRRIPRKLTRALASGKVRVSSTPIIAEDKAIISTRTHGLFSWCSSTSQVKWYNPAASALVKMTNDTMRVYGYDSKGRVYAFSLQDGSLAWKRELGGLLESGPVVHGQNVIFRRKETNGALIALSGATGELAWQQHNESFTQPWSLTDSVVYIPQVIGNIKRFSALDGKMLPTARVLQAGRLSTPVVSFDNRLCAGFDTGIIVMGPADSPPLSSTRLKGEPRHLYLGSDKIFAVCSSPNHIVALSMDDGSILWDHKLSSKSLFKLNENKGRLFVYERAESFQNHLLLLDCASGNLLGRLNTYKLIYCRFLPTKTGTLIVSRNCDIAKSQMFGRSNGS